MRFDRRIHIRCPTLHRRCPAWRCRCSWRAATRCCARLLRTRRACRPRRKCSPGVPGWGEWRPLLMAGCCSSFIASTVQLQSRRTGCCHLVSSKQRLTRSSPPCPLPTQRPWPLCRCRALRCVGSAARPAGRGAVHPGGSGLHDLGSPGGGRSHAALRLPGAGGKERQGWAGAGQQHGSERPGR